MEFYVVADDFGYCPERNRAILVGFKFSSSVSDFITSIGIIV